MYKQSIILFGIVLPFLAIAGVVGGCYMLKSDMEEKFSVKQSKYKVFTQTRNTAMEMENRVKPKREHVARWKTELATETNSTVRTNLQTISSSLPAAEFQETGFDPMDSKSGFAAATQQKSTQFRWGFRGTFRTAQRALLELEARMPQLQLQDLKVGPSGQSSLLNFQTTYTAWEN